MHTRTPSKFEEKFAKKWKKKLARNRSNAKEKLKKKEEEAKMYKLAVELERRHKEEQQLAEQHSAKIQKEKAEMSEILRKQKERMAAMLAMMSQGTDAAPVALAAQLGMEVDTHADVLTEATMMANQGLHIELPPADHARSKSVVVSGSPGAEEEKKKHTKSKSVALGGSGGSASGKEERKKQQQKANGSLKPSPPPAARAPSDGSPATSPRLARAHTPDDAELEAIKATHMTPTPPAKTPTPPAKTPTPSAKTPTPPSEPKAKDSASVREARITAESTDDKAKESNGTPDTKPVPRYMTRPRSKRNLNTKRQASKRSLTRRRSSGSISNRKPPLATPSPTPALKTASTDPLRRSRSRSMATPVRVVSPKDPAMYTTPVPASRSARTSPLQSPAPPLDIVGESEADADKCENCEEHTATVFCTDCKLALCDDGCNEFLHKSRKNQAHNIRALPTATSTTVCHNCESEPARWYCVECDQYLCTTGCNTILHKARAKRTHRRLTLVPGLELGKVRSDSSSSLAGDSPLPPVPSSDPTAMNKSMQRTASLRRRTSKSRLSTGGGSTALLRRKAKALGKSLTTVFRPRRRASLALPPSRRRSNPESGLLPAPHSAGSQPQASDSSSDSDSDSDTSPVASPKASATTSALAFDRKVSFRRANSRLGLRKASPGPLSSSPSLAQIAREIMDSPEDTSSTAVADKKPAQAIKRGSTVARLKLRRGSRDAETAGVIPKET